MGEISFRTAAPADAEALLRIYAPYVRETAISFEYEVPTTEEFRGRIEHTLRTYPYIVAVEQEAADVSDGSDAGKAVPSAQRGRILGYAYVGRLHDRAAYDWSVETSIYVDRSLRHHGLGRQLYARLEALLRAMRIVNVNACIAYPATAEDPYLDTNSPDFHAHLGYQMVGRFHRCAYKFDRWYDMIWMEKRITALPEKPLPMIPFPALAKEVTTGALD